MIKPLLPFLLLSFFASLPFAFAQEAIPASTGNATGSGGSVSYSVGQVFYLTHEDITGSVSEGVQQPYEISVITGIIGSDGIDLIISAFPNPATDHLILRIEQYNMEMLNYQLFDINGKLVQNGKIIGHETIIDMVNLAQTTYLLRVLDKEKEIKKFRIVKF